jgi:hypothetical protein
VHNNIQKFLTRKSSGGHQARKRKKGRKNPLCTIIEYSELKMINDYVVHRVYNKSHDIFLKKDTSERGKLAPKSAPTPGAQPSYMATLRHPKTTLVPCQKERQISLCISVLHAYKCTIGSDNVTL